LRLVSWQPACPAVRTRGNGNGGCT
jgi:hypothetical protein